MSRWDAFRAAMSRPDRKRLVRHWFSSWFIVVLIPVIFCLCELDELSFWPAVLVLPWVAAIGMGLAAPMALAASFVVKTPPYDEI